MERFTSLLPLLGMVAVFAMNHRVSHRRSSVQTSRDGARLRAALAAELAGLRGMFEDNLQLIGSGQEYLLSARAMTCVYRGNVGRLSLLEEAEIDAVVRAYAAMEAAEAFMAGTTKPQGGLAYRALKGEAPFEEIRRRALAGSAAIADALARLEESGRPAIVPPASPRPPALLGTEEKAGAAA